LIMGHAFFR